MATRGGRVGSSVARQRAIGLDVDISWLPTARSERNDANMRAGSGIDLQRSEREQAIEEGAIASQCLPQILGGGLLAV